MQIRSKYVDGNGRFRNDLIHKSNGIVQRIETDLKYIYCIKNWEKKDGETIISQEQW